MQKSDSDSGYQQWLTQRQEWTKEPVKRKQASPERMRKVNHVLSSVHNGARLPALSGLSEVVRVLEKIWLEVRSRPRAPHHPLRSMRIARRTNRRRSLHS